MLWTRKTLQKTFELASVLLVLNMALISQGATAGVDQGADDLVIASQGKSQTIICVDPMAGQDSGQKDRRRKPIIDRPWERQAADDLAKYIEMMTGAKPQIADTKLSIDAALKSNQPLLIVGELALAQNGKLKAELAKASKKKPVLRDDAMVVRREGNRVYLAGTNDDSHYYAAVWLLEQWGCSWYFPTEFGECVPEHKTLAIGKVDHAYAPPFEARTIWLSWNGSYEGHPEFTRRNYMNGAGKLVPAGHAIGKYIKDLAPEGGNQYNAPISDPSTAKHVVDQVAPMFAEGKSFSLSMEDGLYQSDSASDKKLIAGIFDKYFLKDSMTDPFISLYNQVASTLQKRYPKSKAKIGFLIYSNLTIPPQQTDHVESSLIGELAPIDIDPTHNMDDVDSPPRQEYKAMLQRWAKIMDGRLYIYEYDQGMLVWRDLPNPSHQAFETDVKYYAKAGVLGFNTESRGAMATTFTNLFLRGQLMWNPQANVKDMLETFYPKFYGPAAGPTSDFWKAIFHAWANTIVTEHEYFVAPAIYTHELLGKLGQSMKKADQAIAPLRKKPEAQRTRNEKLYVQRMDALDLQWAVLNGYMTMYYQAATDGDYAKASATGKKALAARLKLAEMNPTFTTRVIGRAHMQQDPTKANPAWFPGEVGQYMRLAKLTDGSFGELVTHLPLTWAFHRDPRDTGLVRGWAYQDADLSYWNKHKNEYDVRSRRLYPTTQWSELNTDMYMQAQGVRFPDRQNYEGYAWYKTPVKLTAEQVKGPVHLKFPGLFNEGWLYVNGLMVAHREQKPMWWTNNYAFEWDVDLTGKLKPGVNDITVRSNVVAHFGGMFRRPFLYKVTPAGEAEVARLAQVAADKVKARAEAKVKAAAKAKKVAELKKAKAAAKAKAKSKK